MQHLVLEQEIQCMSHASLEVQVGPVLLYNTNSFMHHASIVRANLNTILRPKFNQVPLQHIHYVCCLPKGINCSQEFFAN
jgi:hypothetical protein